MEPALVRTSRAVVVLLLLHKPWCAANDRKANQRQIDTISYIDCQDAQLREAKIIVHPQTKAGIDRRVDSDDIRACLVDIDVIREDESLSATESLFERGLIDSLGITILITHLEKNFGISVPQQDLLPDNFDSISAIAEYVNSKLREERPK